MVDTSICIINELYGKYCDSQRDKCFTCGPARVESIINASEVYNDALFTNLSTSTNPICTLYLVPRLCPSTAGSSPPPDPSTSVCPLLFLTM